jgi:hypothetical protein
VVERPGKMRWEYAPPDGRVIALDKDAIRIWNRGEAAADRAALRTTFRPPRSAS